MKPCIRCSTVKPLSEFHKHKGMKDGHLNKCRSCVVKDVAEWRQKNPDCRKKEHAANRERKGFKTRSQHLADRQANAIGRKASALKYIQKRRTQQKAYTDFDEFVFEEAVKLCSLRYETTKIKWHVDHIVPLNHRFACGLHVAHNFQVIPATLNHQKGNRHMTAYFPTVAEY